MINIANVSGMSVKVGPPKTIIQKILKGENQAAKHVNVIFCNDKKILELNRRFRQISKPTDVLSFPFNDSDLLGEIYISMDTACRQAKEIGHSPDKEILRLVAHGMLHLLGHNHKKKPERTKMEALEQKYL
jgi:probable rRNA maturation factor